MLRFQLEYFRNTLSLSLSEVSTSCYLYLTTNIFLSFLRLLKMTSCLGEKHPSSHPDIAAMLLFLLPMLILILIRFPSYLFPFPAMSSGCKLQQWQASNRLCCYYFRQLSLPDAQYSLSLSLVLSLPLSLSLTCADSLLPCLCLSASWIVAKKQKNFHAYFMI